MKYKKKGAPVLLHPKLKPTCLKHKLPTSKPSFSVLSINHIRIRSAGQPDTLFLFPNREKVIDALYGSDGLELTF